MGGTTAWTPLSEATLWDMMNAAEGRMEPHIFRLWEAIRIPPEKWSETTCGAAGGGFWAVAVIGNRVLWYNDIEEGFNLSSYVVAGKIAAYWCNQDELDMAVRRVATMIDTGLDVGPRRGPPIAVKG